jgi:hypothetical protein
MRQIRIAVVAYVVSQAGQERQEYPIAGLVGFAVQVPLLQGQNLLDIAQ